MLELYREALCIRRAEPALGDGPLEWLPAPERVLAFTRSDRFACVVNLSDRPVELPEHTAIVLASERIDDRHVGPDTAVWLSVG
jgi:alpha-glucosidase